MTNTEIKAAWNAFKKEAQKELSFSLTGCCYMTQKQINLGTATVTICCNIPYQTEIRRTLETIERVNGYDTWTAEEKKRSEESNLSVIRELQQREEKYGTVADEAKAKRDELLSSKAFKSLASAIGIRSAELELNGENVYQIRISY